MNNTMKNMYMYIDVKKNIHASTRKTGPLQPNYKMSRTRHSYYLLQLKNG